MPSFAPAVRRGRERPACGDRPGPAGVLPAQAGRARGRRLLPVPVGAHPRLQGHAHHRRSSTPSSPTCATSGSRRRWRWCTAGSRPTRSRAGRWRTRSASSRTTARSTPSRGNRNWMRAREALARERPDPGRPRAAVPDLRPRAARDSASFDEVLELLHLGGRSLPHAVHDDDPGGVGEPRRDGPAPAGRSTSSTPR